MSRDANHYNNPEQFDPNRYLGDSEELDPYRYVFGFGRRYASTHRPHVFFYISNREEDVRLIVNGFPSFPLPGLVLENIWPSQARS